MQAPVASGERLALARAWCARIDAAAPEAVALEAAAYVFTPCRCAQSQPLISDVTVDVVLVSN